LFLFLRVENKSKENCKNLGTDRTWHEPPLSKALAWRFTEVGPSKTCASCGTCTLAVSSPLVFIKLPNAVGNFNPKAAEELPSIHKKEAARRIMALPSRWQSMCMINIQHTKFENTWWLAWSRPRESFSYAKNTWPQNVGMPKFGPFLDAMCLPLKGRANKIISRRSQRTREASCNPYHSSRHLHFRCSRGGFSLRDPRLSHSHVPGARPPPGGPPTPMAADVARRWRGRWQREAIHPHRTPERAAYSAITNSSFSFTFPQTISVKFVGFLFAQRQMGQGQVGIESERNKVGK
jgi:hypothetical protein